MEKTDLYLKKKLKNVVEFLGLRKTWYNIAEASFHSTMNTAWYVDGFFVPPLFIVASHILKRAVMDKFCVTNVTIISAPKGFTNPYMLIKWLLYLEQNIPRCVKRPILLVYGGYGSHYSSNIVAKFIYIWRLLLF